MRNPPPPVTHIIEFLHGKVKVQLIQIMKMIPHHETGSISDLSKNEFYLRLYTFQRDHMPHIAPYYTSSPEKEDVDVDKLPLLLSASLSESLGTNVNLSRILFTSAAV